MASLVRQSYSFWTLDGRTPVPKGTSGAKKVRRRAAKWYGQGIPGLPARKRVPLAADKATARAMLAELVAKAERGIAGLPDRTEAALPLGPLVEEYRDYLARDAGEKHVRVVITRVRRVLAGCRLATVADLRQKCVGANVEAFVWGLLKAEDVLSPTAAYIGKQTRSFTRWLWRKRGLLDFDPLAGIDLPSQETEHPRRALSAAELAGLIAAADGSGVVFRGLAGPDRAVLYLVAVATGLRVGELARLTPARFDLDADVPALNLHRKATKNKKAAEQPIPPVVATRLRAYLAGRPDADPIWPGLDSDWTADVFRLDLEAAGIPVVVGDEEATFHSLRHSFTSLLATFAPLKVTQELARHSTPTLTIGRYSHTNMREKADAVARLPLPGAGRDNPLAAMTRADLEAAVVGLLAVVATLTAPENLTPPLTPLTRIAATERESPRRVDGGPTARGRRRKS